jgi:hypothetical protein
VIPSDDRIQQWLGIPEGMEIPARQANRDRVGVPSMAEDTIQSFCASLHVSLAERRFVIHLLSEQEGGHCHAG